MKKTIAFLLATALCLALSACGDNSASSAPGASSEPASAPATSITVTTSKVPSTPQEIPAKTVEITMENWSEYLEIRLVAVEQLNAFQECERIFSDIRLCLKEEYQDSVVDMDLAVECSCAESYGCWFTYNQQTGELVEGEKIDYTNSDSSNSNNSNSAGMVIPAVPYFPDYSRTFTMKQAQIKEGASFHYGVFFGEQNPELKWDGDFVTFKGYTYSKIEVVRIQGIISLRA